MNLATGVMASDELVKNTRSIVEIGVAERMYFLFQESQPHMV